MYDLWISISIAFFPVTYTPRDSGSIIAVQFVHFLHFTDLNQAYENNNNNVSFGGTNTSNYYNNNDNVTTAYVVNEDLYVEVSDKEQEFDNFDNSHVVHMLIAKVCTNLL